MPTLIKMPNRKNNPWTSGSFYLFGWIVTILTLTITTNSNFDYYDNSMIESTYDQKTQVTNMKTTIYKGIEITQLISGNYSFVIDKLVYQRGELKECKVVIDSIILLNQTEK